MKILCDQDVPEPVVEPLRHLLLRGHHKVDHVNEIRWKGKKDRLLLPDAKKRKYHAFLTNDSNQLEDADETKAIKRSGLHHIRYTHRQQGVIGLGLAMGAILAAMPAVMLELEAADGQRLVRITGLSPHSRFEVIDPRHRPPPYWPR